MSKKFNFFPKKLISQVCFEILLLGKSDLKKKWRNKEINKSMDEWKKERKKKKKNKEKIVRGTLKLILDQSSRTSIVDVILLERIVLLKEQSLMIFIKYVYIRKR